MSCVLQVRASRGAEGAEGRSLLLTGDLEAPEEAALLAARRNKRMVAMQEFEDAKDKVLMGAERSNRQAVVLAGLQRLVTPFAGLGAAPVLKPGPA